MELGGTFLTAPAEEFFLRVCASARQDGHILTRVAGMSVVDVMRARLSKATELGVPSREFLRHEFDESLALKCHVNVRMVQAAREIEEAVRQLEHELDTPDEAVMRLATKQALGD